MDRPFLVVGVVFVAAFVGYSVAPEVGARLSITGETATRTIGATLALLIAIPLYVALDRATRYAASNE